MKLFNIVDISEAINNGEVIAYPTETVWGLGASIYKQAAVDKIFEIKGRNTNQALSVLVRDVEMAKTLVMLNQKEKRLLKSFWPGPVSFIFPALDKKIASSLGSNDGTLCLRCSNHDWLKRFILLVESPIVSTSANLSGQPPAVDVKGLGWLPEEVKVVDWQPEVKSDRNLPSTILKTSGDSIKVIRKGAWPVEKLIPLFDKLGYEIMQN